MSATGVSRDEHDSMTDLALPGVLHFGERNALRIDVKASSCRKIHELIIGLEDHIARWDRTCAGSDYL
jgi:hypothetical protein